MKTGFYCKYDLYDKTAIEDGTVTSDTNQSFGTLSGMSEDIGQPDYATLEQDYFVLDGSMPELPDSPDDVVYFSSVMSNSSGIFSTNPEITVTFTENHTSAGITFYFVGDPPLKMQIRWYNGNGSTLANETFEIDSATYFAAKQVKNYQKVIVTFLEANPYRYVKLRYIQYGTQTTFGDGGTPVKNAELVEECDPISDTISINELTFDVIDEDDIYNPGNIGALHEALQAGQEVLAYEKLNGDDIFLGKFYLSEYTSESNIASFTFVDIKGLLDNKTFRAGRVYSNEYAGNIIDDIMTAAGISDYTVSDEVQSIKLSGWLSVQTCRNALREVLFACGAVAESSHSETLDIYIAGQTSVSAIYRARKFSTKVKKKDYVSSVSVSYPVYTLSTDTTTIASGDYSAGTYTVDLSSPAENMVINTGTIDEQTNNYVTFTLAEDAEVEITGQKYEKEDLSAVATVDELSAGETSVLKEFSCSLATPELAAAAASRILTYYGLELEITTRFLNWGECVPQWVTIQNANKLHAGFVAGIEKLTTDLTGGFISTAELRGYYNLTTEYIYLGDEVYTGEEVGVI